MSITPYRNNKSVVYSLKRFRQRHFLHHHSKQFHRETHWRAGWGWAVLGVVEHLHRNIGHQQTKMTGGAAQTAGSVFDREGAKQEAATEKESVGFSVCQIFIMYISVFIRVCVCVFMLFCVNVQQKKNLRYFKVL